MPPTVLLGNLEPIVELGMACMLEEDGIAVLGTETRPAGLASAAGRGRPDAVVLDLGRATSRALADRIRAAWPQTTLVFWARDEDVMEVVGPGTAEPRRIFAPAPEELRSTLLRSQAT